MGRRPQSPGAIPHFRARRRGTKVWYYFDHGGRPRKEEPLGCDWGLAIKRWAEITHESHLSPAQVVTFRQVADEYRAVIIPTKAPRTQKDNAKELAKLIAFFDQPPCPLDAIEPKHVAQYLKWRGAKAKVRANREKALLSHIWNWARGEGYTARANPCAGIKGFRETGRDAYIEDDLYAAVWNAADAPLRDAMDLAYLTGQRVADTLTMAARDIRDGFLHVKQGKTGTKRRIEVTAALAQLLERIEHRKANMAIHATHLIVNERGQPLGMRALEQRFVAARKAAEVDPAAFQFRDLRAKAGTDKAEARDIREAQQQLGHANLSMTEHYVRNRRGSKVTPTR